MNFNATLIGQMISFAVFVWFTMKFVWPPLVKALEERKAKIAEGLAAAERGQHEQVLAEKAAAEHILKAKQQAAEIVAKAEKRAREIEDEATDKARTKAGQIVTAGEAEVEQMASKAREELRGKVAQLAVVGAEKILRKEIDADAHKDIVDAVAARI